MLNAGSKGCVLVPRRLSGTRCLYGNFAKVYSMLDSITSVMDAKNGVPGGIKPP